MIRLVTEDAENLEARTNMIWMMTANTANPKSRNVINRKSVKNTQNRIRQTHPREILISPKKVTIDARDAKIRRAIGERILSIRGEVI